MSAETPLPTVPTEKDIDPSTGEPYTKSRIKKIKKQVANEKKKREKAAANAQGKVRYTRYENAA